MTTTTSIKVTLLVIVALTLLVSSAFAFSWVKQGKNYLITLDTGKVINVTDIAFNKSTNVITATIAKTKLTPKDILAILNVTQTAENTLDSKKNDYSVSVIVQR